MHAGHVNLQNRGMYEPISSIKPVNPETGTRSLQLNLREKKLLKLQQRLAHVPAITRISSRDSGRSPDAARGEEEEGEAVFGRRGRRPWRGGCDGHCSTPFPSCSHYRSTATTPAGARYLCQTVSVYDHQPRCFGREAPSRKQPSPGRPRAQSRGHRVERRGRRRAHASCVTGSGSASADELP